MPPDRTGGRRPSAMDASEFLNLAELPEPVAELLNNARSVAVASSIEELEALACGGPDCQTATVGYELPDGRYVEEVDVVRVKNGISANYRETYMRRRDPDCMVVADNKPSDKPRFADRFDFSFEDLKQETFEWLAGQDLAVFAFAMGQKELRADALAICPVNAGFFAFGLGLLQGVVDIAQIGRPLKPTTVIYVAPPFRHTHFDGKQVVAHDRADVHEIFSYNLYPGPSAKKGVYGALIELGEQQGWVTAHCSAVEVVTPYDNIVCMMHEGASGGGKSEMLEYVHREENGKLLLGLNLLNGDTRTLVMSQTCKLYPVTDDMAMCRPIKESKTGYLQVKDAEQAWFLRVNHIERYGTDPHLESVTIHPKAPLLFLNIDGKQDSTALLWEHIEDQPGRRCPNPRVILPRKLVPDVVDGTVDVMVRSFGVRTPPCSREKPNYGIIGFMHLLPPALAWLWRLVAPRGHGNPSITDSEGIISEGVGSYWPFATGRIVDHANLLLRQMQSTPRVRYVLIPNQHVGIWKTGFMPQWISREYLARRGIAPFRSQQITPARCKLLGYAFNSMQVEGTRIPQWMLQVNLQREVGTEGYDAGAKILEDFFTRELKKFLHNDLDKLGKDIVNCCIDGGTLEDFESFLPDTAH